MPVVIRRVLPERFENHVEIAGASWDLRFQIETLEEWLVANSDQLDPVSEWVADVGFTVRRGAVGGGPAITHQLMQKCLAANLIIYLSEYGGGHDSVSTPQPK